MAAGETVLYYNPDGTAKPAKLTGVLFRMKVRIRRVKPEEILETVGYLAGIKGFESREGADGAGASCGGSETLDRDAASDGEKAPEKIALPFIDEEMMVMSNFSNSRLNELLAQMRKAGAPRIALKAMVTPTNCRWSFYDLYREIRQEHEALNQPQGQ